MLSTGPDLGFTLITPSADIDAARHGGRAKCLQRLIRLDMPVPPTVALDFASIQDISAGQIPDLTALLDALGEGELVSVRPSSQDSDWGGPSAILNIGMTDQSHAHLAKTHGAAAADALYLRFIQSYSNHVARLDPDVFSHLGQGPDALAAALELYTDETDQPFPQDPAVQLAEVLRSMARAWQGTTARLLREAKGAPADAGLGLVVQRMALGVGRGLCGSGVIQFVEGASGERGVRGRYLCQSQGRDALTLEGDHDILYLTRDARGRSIEDVLPQNFADLLRFGDLCRTRLREEMQIEFTIENEQLFILDAVRVGRSERANLRINVALAQDGIISREEALMRIPPRALSELLHSHIDPEAPRDVLATG
ncbi:MAG TPA: pyruvate, phosphate dikinase, partial [Aliiroseovarius sp.]|nr:pyruvate, phosphate dikinase [Aliiroseovarius sp.]